MDSILQDFSPSTVSLALDANEIAFWTFLFSRFPHAGIHDDPEALWLETGIFHDVFNRVLQTRLESGMSPAVLDRIAGHFQQHRMPFLWHVGPSSRPPNIDTFLQERGLFHHETEPGMALDLYRYNEAIPAATGVTIHPVTTAELLQQWIRIWEFGSSEEMIDLWFTLYSAIFQDKVSRLHLYLGFVDGKPVATSGIFFAGGVASIGPIGTLPSYRGQGIGGTMTLAALREARAEGYRVAVLTASSMGINIYRRIGFQEICTCSTYLWHPKYS